MTLSEIKAALRRLRDEKTTEQRDEHAAHILSFRFLSEVERITKERGITRKELATEVGTSASYITQLFRGTCTLNLLMAAKLERVLGTQFHIKAMLPISGVASPEAHPAMLRKMPTSLQSKWFAQQQATAGGQYQPYSTTPATLTPAIANALS